MTSKKLTTTIPTMIGIVLALATISLTQNVTPAYAAVGDIIATIDMEPHWPAASVFCSIGVASDTVDLYTTACGSGDIKKIATDGTLLATIPSGVPELPNAMAWNSEENSLIIGAQGCNALGMPIYSLDLDTGVTSLLFTIPFALLNPATGESFLGFCFTDGLALNVNGAGTLDNEIYFSDDVNHNLGKFDMAGVLLAGFDTATIDPSLDDFPTGSGNSGLAVGGPILYLGNNGGGDVFRADETTFTFIDLFFATDERQEDMECDPFSFLVEVMWVRTTPQGGLFPNVLTAHEIEAGQCSPLPLTVGGLVIPTDAMALIGAGISTQFSWLVLLGITATASFGTISFMKLRKNHCQ